MFDLYNNNLTDIVLSSIQDLKSDDNILSLLSLLKFENLTTEEFKYFKGNLHAYLEELNDDIKIIMESGYVDKVYRESYYDYFSTKNNEYSRYCVRLSFFKGEFDLAFNKDLFNKKKIEDNYLGFLILRPLLKCIGRNVLDPKAKKNPVDNIEICKVEIPTSCMGFKLNAKGFPHASQDSETMTCAQTSIWSIMEYFGNKYPEYTPVSPTKIEEILEPSYYKRLLPAGGLNIDEISITLRKFGFGCEVDFNNLKSPSDFYERIACYIESGVPLAIGLSDLSGGEGHETVCVGHEYFPKDEVFHYTDSIGCNTVYSWNKAVSHAKFVFNDDNFPCYQMASLDNPTDYASGFGYRGSNFKITEIKVPLHKKVYMDANTAIDLSKAVIGDYLNFKEPIVVKTYLTSSRTYRNYISTDSGLDITSKLAFLLIPLPKFLWVTEISSKDEFLKGQLNSIIILDATGTNRDNHMKNIIFMESFGTIYEYFKNIKGIEGGRKILPESFNAFKGNLRN